MANCTNSEEPEGLDSGNYTNWPTHPTYKRKYLKLGKLNSTTHRRKKAELKLSHYDVLSKIQYYDKKKTEIIVEHSYSAPPNSFQGFDENYRNENMQYLSAMIRHVNNLESEELLSSEDELYAAREDFSTVELTMDELNDLTKDVEVHTKKSAEQFDTEKEWRELIEEIHNRPRENEDNMTEIQQIKEEPPSEEDSTEEDYGLLDEHFLKDISTIKEEYNVINCDMIDNSDIMLEERFNSED